MSKLAINGGVPIRQGLLPAQMTTGEEEKTAANEVMQSKLLSGFRGNASDAFYGGPRIQEFEKSFIDLFDKPGHKAVSVNSCTSALQLACGAIGLQPGDEVVVTPWSMCCSATAPLLYGAVPVFADIEKDYFCLDPDSVESKITSRTKAIIVVDLFGQPFSERLIEIAQRHGLLIIEDAAQAIGSYYENLPAGFMGHIGCFSFTQGKHLTAGEGGMAVTAAANTLCRNLMLLRNHAEAVINDMGVEGIWEANMVGFNMRMTEMQAAILSQQLRKLKHYVNVRKDNASFFAEYMNQIPGIKAASIRPNCSHSFYVQAFHYAEEVIGVPRDKFIHAVKAELKPQEGRVDLGVPISCGYTKPLYKIPLFQQNMHWALMGKNYRETSLPVVERLWQKEIFLWTLNGLDMTAADRRDIINAFFKVYENREELK